MNVEEVKVNDWMDIAKYLYNKVDFINNLKLQKMMFFAYIEYYKNYKKELFKDNFEAWVYGPVLPELYYSFYKLLLPDTTENDIKDKDIKNTLDYIIKKYGNKNAFDLVDLTHSHPTWRNARSGILDNQPSNIKINLKEFLINEK